MKVSDRRLSRRQSLRIPLLVRIAKSTAPERRVESANLSKSGIYFATDLPLREGSVVQLFLKMPAKIVGKSMEMRYTGHVVRFQPISSLPKMLGVGVQFDCYQALRTVVPSPS